jgi:hypothetical protein
MAHPSERACYCGPDDAFCGTCETCGRPGHTRHMREQPFTGAWCDECYARERPRSRPSTWLVAASAALLVLLLAGWCVL